MVSHLHEMLVEMFRERPGLAEDLLTDLFGVSLPAFQQAHVSSGELNQIAPTEYRADAVITFNDADRPVLAVVVEVQLGDDPDKQYTWPVYVAGLRARLRCPVWLLVLCPDPAVAARYDTPLMLGGPGVPPLPLVLGPQKVPVVTDLALARSQPELAVLSALAYAQSGKPEVFEALAAGLRAIDHDHGYLYADIMLTELPEAARDYLEGFMSTAFANYEFQSDFARRYFGQVKAESRAEGTAEGEARAVLAVLDARGIDVPDQVRENITGCTDLDQLDTWIRRAVTANTADDLFD